MNDVVDIDRHLLVEMPLPNLDPEGDKKDRGTLLVIAGGAAVPGAALLAGLAGLRAGAGRLALAVPSTLAPNIGVSLPEARVHYLPATAAGEIAASAPAHLINACAATDAVIIGPGMIDEAAAGALSLDVIKAGARALVIDAGALTGLATRRNELPLRDMPVVLTPHAGELAKFMGCPIEQIQSAPRSAAQKTASELGATIVLKGAETYVTDPSGRCWRLRSACPGLATSGSGDVLAGLIGGLLARGADGPTSALWGVYIHAAVGQTLSSAIAPVGFLAREMADAIPREIAKLY